MELIKLIWDILKTLLDIFKTIRPQIAKRLWLRRNSWPKLVRSGAISLGTPAKDIEELLQAFDAKAFYVAKSHHPIIDEIRSSIWESYYRLDEFRLLSVAERSKDINERCWAINQISQRSGSYAIPILQSISDSLNTPEIVKKATDRAIKEISLRNNSRDA